MKQGAFLNIFSGVYSSTNWPPFNGGQSSILTQNVISSSSSTFKLKTKKNCLYYLERALERKKDLKRKRLGHQMMHGKAVWKPGGLEPPAARVSVLVHIELWPTAVKLKHGYCFCEIF